MTLTWSSDRGPDTNGGASRRIGLSFVQVATSASAIVSNAPVVTSTSSLSATVGVPLSYQIAATESPTGFWVTNRPAALSFNKSTGLISGTLTNTNPGGSPLGLVAYNAAGYGEAALTLSVGKGTPTIVTNPTASAITNGLALSNSILSGGLASVAGAFGWSAPATLVTASGPQAATFTPTDTNNWLPVSLDVNVSVLASGTTFEGWSGGAPLNAANLAKYAIGGASSLTATDGQGTVQGGDATTLTLTAIVRTDDTTLTIAGEASTSLTNGWSTSGVTSSNAASQVGVPQGFTKKVYSVTRGVDERKFLRIRATK